MGSHELSVYEGLYSLRVAGPLEFVVETLQRYLDQFQEDLRRNKEQAAHDAAHESLATMRGNYATLAARTRKKNG